MTERHMTDRHMMAHQRECFKWLMEGRGTPNERAALARRCQRDIEKVGKPPELDDLYRQFQVIEDVAMATFMVARNLHGRPWWGWINDDNTSGDATFTSQERRRDGESTHDLYRRAFEACARTEPRAYDWRRQYITKQLRAKFNSA